MHIFCSNALIFVFGYDWYLMLSLIKFQLEKNVFRESSIFFGLNLNAEINRIYRIQTQQKSMHSKKYAYV